MHHAVTWSHAEWRDFSPSFVTDDLVCHSISYMYHIFSFKGRTIRKLMGGGGGGGAAGEVQKENSREGKLNEKKWLHAN